MRTCAAVGMCPELPATGAATDLLVLVGALFLLSGLVSLALAQLMRGPR